MPDGSWTRMVPRRLRVAWRILRAQLFWVRLANVDEQCFSNPWLLIHRLHSKNFSREWCYIHIASMGVEFRNSVHTAEIGSLWDLLSITSRQYSPRVRFHQHLLSRVWRWHGCLFGPWGFGGRQARQTLEGSFSSLSKPMFASKYSFESSRRDLRNTHFCTDLRSQSFKCKLSFFLKRF